MMTRELRFRKESEARGRSAVFVGTEMTKGTGWAVPLELNCSAGAKTRRYELELEAQRELHNARQMCVVQHQEAAARGIVASRKRGHRRATHADNTAGAP